MIRRPAISTATLAEPTFADVAAARDRIAAAVHRTPVLTSRLFNRACGCEVYFKAENLQRTGSFKIRGATNFLRALTPAERSRGVVTFSSGNHGQAVALAASEAGVAATVVMPTDAPRAKRLATEAYSARIVEFDRMRENREQIARRLASESGAAVVPSYDHPWIIGGQGTATLEFLEDAGELDALVVPIGGGGLLSGALLAAHRLRPGLPVFGAEPELASDTFQSFQRRERVTIAPPATIADGLRTPSPGAITFPIVQRMARGILLVSEQDIRNAVAWMLTRMKLLVEPSGAVAAAAVLSGKLPQGLRRVGVLLSGGNADLESLDQFTAGAPPDGR